MTIFYSPTNKGFYDSQVGYSSYPPDIIDVTSEYHNLLDGVNSKNKKIVVTNGLVHLVDKDSVAVTWDQIRQKRNRLLSESDWTQMPDVVNINKLDWAGYRSFLRNIPQTFSNPEDVVFPEKP